MAMNPRDIIEQVLENWLGTGVRECGEQILDALCPPGSRVVVERTTSVCTACSGDGRELGYSDPRRCPVCGGSGVVEATTTYGPEEDWFLNADAGRVPGLFDDHGERLADGGLWVRLDALQTP